MRACVATESVRGRKPTSFTSKPGESICTCTFGRHFPFSLPNMARVAQPVSDVRVGSSSM